MEIAILIIVIIELIVSIFLCVRVFKNKNNALSENDIELINKSFNDVFKDVDKFVRQSIESASIPYYSKIEEKTNNINNLIDKLNQNNSQNYEKILDIIHKNQMDVVKLNEEKNLQIVNNVNASIKEFKDSITERMNEIKLTTESNLNQIRKDVDEKLEKTLETRLKQSFDNVITQISSVDKAIGEIKGLASDVGSLKNVLTNVKTKGIVGEIVLGNLIKEVLTIDQYEENIATKKGSSERVEFAVKMPGNDDSFVYLPIDSKFPLESYYKIKEGIDEADPIKVENARKELRNKIKTFAKDIANKYIEVPNTTDFAIMFLPIEGLYIEALELGLFEEIQRTYKVNIVGPSTLSALLNALQMGFKSYIIQKRSAEVFNLLGAVKTEFENFASVLEKTQRKVNEANDELDKLVGVRTRKIQAKLKNISTLDEKKASEILEINND